MLPRVSAKKLTWTFHSRAKMRRYGLSESRVRRVLHAPRRVEMGVAPKTVAMMQPAALKSSGAKASWSQEIWVMIQDAPKTRKVISAWRYPGMSKLRDEITKEFLTKEFREYTTTETK